ncbi:HET-domain-containing protein [Lentinus brumalis]|uniref:HET-domain-containing protein n=1 Tax=Lentinus brumalis TaxID=2498619 RepID=A0A371D3J0_9APHY|nr:HET-domain-containing protein [Polyporus brumalis]
MWFLSTDRAELHFFPSPENVSDGYAALSHVWDKEEQSFQDVRKIQENCAKDGTNPRDFVSEKIRRCCALAEKHGYKWVWIDICCIDKTSSAELSEAINSMFRYYALARICYGYLPDVSSVEFSLEDVEKDRNSRKGYRHSRYRSFGRSIWFTRGWTLQELIAPRFFVFLSSSWKIIGTKADLAELMEWWCAIPAAVLRFQVRFTEFSIAQRMSWFGLRETTRPEDEAYCLLGLFDIHMPPLYGEGRNAFRRLQEEILKQSADTTLFAWSGHSRCLFAASPSDFVRDAGIEVVYTPPPPTQVLADTVHEAECWTFCLPCSHLVALVCGAIAPVTLRGVSPPEIRGGAMNDMTFAITPTGIRACIPIFTWRGEVFGDLHWSSPQGGRVFLRLELDPDSQASSSRRPSYRVGRPRLARSFFGGAYRTVRPPDGLPSWKEILIRHRPPLHRDPGQLPAHSATGPRLGSRQLSQCSSPLMPLFASPKLAFSNSFTILGSLTLRFEVPGFTLPGRPTPICPPSTFSR